MSYGRFRSLCAMYSILMYRCPFVNLLNCLDLSLEYNYRTNATFADSAANLSALAAHTHAIQVMVRFYRHKCTQIQVTKTSARTVILCVMRPDHRTGIRTTNNRLPAPPEPMLARTAVDKHINAFSKEQKAWTLSVTPCASSMATQTSTAPTRHIHRIIIR